MSYNVLSASPEYPDPDWTVGLKVRYADGKFYIMDMERFRARPMTVKARIKNITVQDGQGVEQFLEGDPGSAGDFETASYIQELAGYTVRTNKPTKAKYERARPFMCQAEAGNVVLVRGPWKDAFLDELVQFGEDDTKYAHDDIVDCGSGSINVLTKASDGFTSPDQIRVGRPTTFAVDRLSALDLRL